jgi:hypothetical protein
MFTTGGTECEVPMAWSEFAASIVAGDYLAVAETGGSYFDDTGYALVDGQHRLCALRAAGVASCPVTGAYLPDTDYGPPMEAAVHAALTAARVRS